MGSKMKNVISKRRPRQNIIAMILKNAKKKGSGGSMSSTTHSTAASSSRSASGGDDKNSKSRGRGGGSSYGYHGSKKGILKSAVELTRRSKRAGSRSRRGKSKGRGRSIPFVKGQKAFYRSAKGIAKVTVVGIHHDAKLEPYYTIKLRDGKEKQTDGKHLTAIQVDVKKSGSGGSVSSSRSNRGGGGSNSGTQQRSSPEVVTDHMTESSSEVEEIIIEEIEEEEDDEELHAVGGSISRRNIGGDDDEEEDFEASSEEDDDANKFIVDQDAYYRPPEGGIQKVCILSYGEDPNHPRRYAISLPDGSRRGNVKSFRLATLMDLTSKELSMLMKERNKRQNRPNPRGRSRSGERHNYHHHHRSNSRQSRSSLHSKSSAHSEDEIAIDKAVIDEGYMAAEEGERASSSMERSLSHNKHGESLAFPPPERVIPMVEAKTEDGGTKMVPMYVAGMHVRYKNAAGIQPAEILDAHLDDLMEPYYSIRLADGREKQTDNAHILLEDGEEEDDEQEVGSNGEEEYKEEAGGEVFSRVEVFSQAEEEVVHQGGGGEEANGYLADPLTERVQNLQHLPNSASDSERRADQFPKKRHENDLFERSEDTTSSPAWKKQDPAAEAQAVASVTSTLDPTASVVALVQPGKFAAGDEVLYSSSQGEHHRAVVVSLLRDKKNRPYYVVRLERGKEKQVYGHRLRPYVRQEHDRLVRQDHDGSVTRDHDDSRRARSRSRGRGRSKPRGRSISKVSKSGRRGHSKTTKDLRRSESIMSNSSRRSKTSQEGAVDRDESLASSKEGRHRRGEESSARGRQSREESLSSQRRTRDESLSSQQRTCSPSKKRSLRSRSQSIVRRGKSLLGSGGEHYRSDEQRRHKRSGRERSRSRAPPSLEESASLRSSTSSHHQFSAAHHHHAMAGDGGKGRLGARGVSTSSRTMTTSGGGDSHSHYSGSVGREEEHRHGSKGNSISKLRSFRKSFAGRKKRH